MRVRSVPAVGLDRFVESGGDPAHHGGVRRYLDAMFAAGSMRREWCFVAEEHGGPVGRIAFWTLPGMEEPLALVLFDAPWGGPPGDGRAAPRARAGGGPRAGRRGDRTPPRRPADAAPIPAPSRRTDRVARGRRVLHEVRDGTLRVAGRKASRRDGSAVSFRTLEEVGEAAFVDALVRVSEGTLDREIRAERRSLGPEGAARDFFEDASRVAHGPSWWRLAYDGPDGGLVGLVMPAHPPGSLTIFYVGVVPEMRGRGHVDGLLAAGTTTLLPARDGNDAPLRADTDVYNAPMSAAFERAGWTRFALRREYAAALEPTHDDE